MKTINQKMKWSILLLLLFSFTISTVSATEKLIYEGTTIYVKIEVDGLACPFCAYGLEKKIKKIDGAENLYIDINEGFVTFSVPTDKKPTEDSLQQVVKDAGFKVRKIEYSKTPFKTKKDE